MTDQSIPGINSENPNAVTDRLRSAPCRGIISVDVEDFFHATNLDQIIGPSRWHAIPRRVEESTGRVLDLFDRCDTKGTFFVLGYSARRAPQLVREIAKRGHEVASHGYGHRLAYTLSERSFFRDVYRTKHLLEQLIGAPVIGYRAPNFSIRDSNAWAYDALIAAGYRYDSSLYPVWHPRYANIGKPATPFLVRRPGGTLGVVPLATWEIAVGGRRIHLPVAGGAYWRTLPRIYSSLGLRSIVKSGRPYCCYFHPWELDAGQPVFKQLPFITRLRHYGGTARFESRLEYFLRRFKFTSLRELLPYLFDESLT